MLLLTAYTWLISDYVYWETNSVYFLTQTDSTYGYYLLSFEPFSYHVGRQSEQDRGKPIQHYALHQKHTWTAQPGNTPYNHLRCSSVLFCHDNMLIAPTGTQPIVFS
jgi:hypothetical protein